MSTFKSVGAFRLNNLWWVVLFCSSATDSAWCLSVFLQSVIHHVSAKASNEGAAGEAPEVPPADCFHCSTGDCSSLQGVRRQIHMATTFTLIKLSALNPKSLLFSVFPSVHSNRAQEKGLRWLLQAVRLRQRIQRYEGGWRLRECAAFWGVNPLWVIWHTWIRCYTHWDIENICRQTMLSHCCHLFFLQFLFQDVHSWPEVGPPPHVIYWLDVNIAMLFCSSK